MIIDCISDLHGKFPKLEGGDLLIVAGDLTANDTYYECEQFGQWLGEQNYSKKVVIAGNHDNSFLVNKRGDIREGTYLCDSGTEFDGLKIWGSPWTLWFHGVNPDCDAFMLPEHDIKEKWDKIPDDTDILITHGPPLGILDMNMYDMECGSESLLYKIFQVRPKLHVFGHIHECGGCCVTRINTDDKGKDIGSTKFVNASLVNEWYRPVNEPIRVVL